MGPYRIDPPVRPRPSGARLSIFVVLFALLIGARSIASYAIEYAWWKEVGQLETWFSTLTYSLAPKAAATVLAFAIFWIAHARGMKFAGASLRQHRAYARIATLGALVLAFLVSAASIDTWDMVRYAGARGLPAAATEWKDAVFGQPLGFYLFDLPFFLMLWRYVLAVTVLAAAIWWLTARAWDLGSRLGDFREAQDLTVLLQFEGALESRFLRGAGALVLLGAAVRFYFARYEKVWNDHGFMVGIDYVDFNIGLPLQWVLIAAAVGAAVLLWLARPVFAGILLLIAFVVQFAIPKAVSALYVRPNEISLQRPYIQSHIQATRRAYGLEGKLREVDFKARQESPIDRNKHQNLLANVRLWDMRAFHDTVTQIQALRPYYTFADSDVDRYIVNGQYRQVLLSPRELDIRQLQDARTRWINPHFIYTHGYGMVMAEVAEITPDGLPKLLVQDAPPEVAPKDLKLTRPEIYYGEVTHEPVFVHTAQQEFNYPSGADNVFSKYEGKGGFPIASFPMRLAAAVRYADPNILLTGYLTGESRMMIRRDVRDRLETLADFIQWDSDPYMVVAEDGRQVWMVDGYTTSNAHPYARMLRLSGAGAINYVRNSVKAVVDAYDGSISLYIFDSADPIIQAYRSLFPKLFRPASDMPAGLRAHARYPETLFRIQAEIYRTYHMLDPQAFYNKEDLWDLARTASGPGSRPEPVSPTYIVASLPGSDKLEFLLLTAFTPRSKDNLIGLMLARCDGENLGEIVVLQLSKQELIFGPMQIAARINQDQVISKDLTLWNQQGSQVLRGQTLVLPIEDTFLYVEPIYIQATEARMPQLRKVVLAIGNRLIYADTYGEAVAQLGAGGPSPAALAGREAGAPSEAAPGAQPAPTGDPRVDRIRGHLRRYRELMGQGRWSDAAKELEAIEGIAGR